MRIIVCKNYEELSEKAANIVASQLTLKPDSVIGLATGSTPLGMYSKLAEMNKSGEIDFSDVISFNLDEYYPIKKDNSQSYDKFMKDNLFSKINIKPENTHIPNGEATDPIKECDEYERLIKENGGIDLQILGIGQNGHIGFNEPDASLSSRTHLTNLTENTIKANSRFFASSDEVPRQALTMGIATILKARKIILLANGANKSRVVSELLNDGINTSVSATLLKTHPFYLAGGIESLANIFGPDCIVLAGGVTLQGDKLLAPLKAELKKDIRVEISTLQRNAGALGAAML